MTQPAYPAEYGTDLAEEIHAVVQERDHDFTCLILILTFFRVAGCHPYCYLYSQPQLT
jgi:hypothetical protein